MPDLLHTLQGRDLGFLKMIAGLWGVELDAPNARTALNILTRAMLDEALVNEIVESLPTDAREALNVLLEQGGSLPWTQFSRQYGEVRSMGPARRDRERPDLHPQSPTETLWYYGLLGQAFLDQPPEPQQYAYIPEDLLALIHAPQLQPAGVYGRPASPAETVVIYPTSDRILDHACTLLAARRTGIPDEQIPMPGWQIPLPDLQALLTAAGLLDGSGLPLPEPTRLFLEAPRAEALLQLASAWLHSPLYNELRLLPGLICEGDWENDPLFARTRLIEHLSRLPQGNWWNLSAFLADLKQNDPDFQRPAGDYDSWFIRRARDGQFLSGFASWDEVDGALARRMICGQLHWLGFLDLAAPSAGAPASAFRSSAWSANLWKEQPPVGLPDETSIINVYSDGRIEVPRLTQRALRYNLARFTDWEAESEDGYAYRITPASLNRAHRQGLRPAQLASLLKKHARALPPTLLTALERWQQHGTEARLEPALLLRVSRPEILSALRKHRAARYLGEQLSDTVVVVRPGGEKALLQALAEMGYLGEARTGSEV